MSEPDKMPASPLLQAAAQASTPWGRFVAVVGLVVCGFWVYAQNIETAGPALSSPPAVVASYFLAVASGIAIDHWFFARPRLADLQAHLARLQAHTEAMDALIAELRKEERSLREDKGYKAAEIAELRTSLKYLREDMDAMIAASTARADRPKRTPKS
jgi:hypothetical protein